jgi:hypothetical protein
MNEYDDYGRGFPGTAPWRGPGDHMYSAPAHWSQSLIQIKDDHSSACACEIENGLGGDAWCGSGDSMHWYPGDTDSGYFACDVCGRNHGAECPQRAEIVLARINFAGSLRRYDVVHLRPGEAS